MTNHDNAERAWHYALGVLIHKYPGWGIDHLRDVATDGVMDALRTWRSNGGASFQSFAATKAIRQMGRPNGTTRSDRKQKFLDGITSIDGKDWKWKTLGNAWVARGVRLTVDISELKADSREKQMIEMRLRGMTLKDIGAVYGLTEGRASQIMKKVIGANRD
jgi:DNA-directed RNA polymerase specialized sigma subunit